MEENIYKQHEENTDWMSRVAFYKDEITILQRILTEIASKNTGDEALKEVEHYQNQFIVQQDNLDHLAQEKDFIEYFEKNFKSLRTDFKTFASKWM